jgi:hypothetical protein
MRYHVMPTTVSRRLALKSAFAAFSALAGFPLNGRTATVEPPKGERARLYVPGYRSQEAVEEKTRLIDQAAITRVPRDWHGDQTLLTMLDLADSQAVPKRAAYPVGGHGVHLFPALGVGVFAGMESDSVVGFDLETMDMTAFARPVHPGWLFGGHPVGMPDGRHVAIAERHPAQLRSGDRAADIKRLCGRIVIRDARTLSPVGEMSSFGIRPHEIQITADAKHMVVANYGSTNTREPFDALQLPDVLAPGIAVIEIASGKRVAWIAGADPAAELRHLVAPRLDRIFGITARLAFSDSPEAAGLPQDPVAAQGISFLASPPVRVLEGRALALMKEQPTITRQGLSIAFDVAHDEVLASFPASHAVAVFDGASGEVKKLIHTAAMGLHWPCGLALSPDAAHWYVTGYWRGILTLEAGQHGVESVTDSPQWWGHSHTAMA